MVDHRHDQPLVQRHGHSDADVVLQVDRVSIKTRVHTRVLFKGVGAGLDDEVGVRRVELALHLLAAVD